MALNQRERWTSRTAFIMAAVGSAVGLGNVWRFPIQAFRHGGGAFLVPYFIALVTAGIPLMIVEYALGQKYQSGAPGALASVTKKFRWVGWFALLVGTTITLYYVVVMSYACFYAVSSWGVDWTRPAPFHEVHTSADGQVKVEEVPASRVKVYLHAPTPEGKQRLEAVQASKPADERLPVLTDEELARAQEAEQHKPLESRTRYVAMGANVENFFSERCLGRFRHDVWGAKLAYNESIREQPSAPPQRYLGEMFEINLPLAIGALVVWLAMFLIIFKGIRNVGRVVMVTVPLPVVLLAIMVIRGLTLPGASTGLIYYLKPDWEMLKDPAVWTAAYGQIFFSLSLGFGILIAYASYMPEDSDVTNSAFITSFANCATSFFAGLAVFSVLGYLAYLPGQPVDQVVPNPGPGLVFITYPIALAEMPMAAWAIALLSFIFFLCLISLGIDSAFSILEGVIAGFHDRFAGITKAKMTAIFCSLGFVGSLFFCTRSGLMWLDIVDNWMTNYGLALVGLLECVAVGYFFDFDELKDYINKHSEVKVHNWFDAFIKFVTPAVLIFLLSSQFLKDITATYGGYDKVLPNAVNVAGWGLFAVIFVCALILGKSWKKLAWTLSAIGVFLLIFAYLSLTSDAPASELVAPSAMGAVGTVLLFGGLITCIHIAWKTRHMAGLSLEAKTPPEQKDVQDKDAES